MGFRCTGALLLALGAVASETETDSFKTEVLPILEKRYAPCHFKGGKVYAKLPFDRPSTPRKLGERLFTRIKDPKEQATLRRFLAEAEPKAATPPKSDP